MAVAQLGHHLRQYFEELLACHGVGDAAGIAFVHLVPVEPVLFVLVGEETILTVDDAPQGLKVGLGRMALHVLAHTGTEQQEGDGSTEEKEGSLHGINRRRRWNDTPVGHRADGSGAHSPPGGCASRNGT